MKKQILLLLSTIVLVFACEYETADISFKEKMGPDPNKSLIINLSEIQPNDIIYMYQPTWFNFLIDTQNNSNYDITVFLNGELLSANWNGFFLDPTEFDNSTHDLTILITAKTNTGSLIEKLGMEKYTGESKYKVKFIRTTKQLLIREDISDEGYMMLTWENPSLEGLEVEKYEILHYGLDNRPVIISDPDETFYLHKNFIGGNKEYTIKTYFKGNKMDPWENRFIGEDYPIMNGDPIKIEIIDLEKMKISWTKNKYKCMYTIVVNNFDEQISIDLEHTENSLIISGPPFPRYIFGSFEIFSELHYGQRHHESYYIQKGHPKLDNIDISAFAYDTSDNTIYGLGPNSIAKYNINNKQFLKDIPIESINYHNDSRNISCSPVTHKVAAMKHNNTVYILNNHLEITKEFTVSSLPDYLGYNSTFQITDNDLLIIGGNPSTQPSEFSVYNTSGVLLYKTTLPITSPYQTTFISTSDGRLCCLIRNDISIYQFDETGATSIYNQNIPDIVKCDIHPTNRDILIVQKLGSFSIFNISTNQTILSVPGTYISTDPFTGNIAYYDKNFSQNRYLHLLDPNTNALLTKIRIAEDNNPIYGDFKFSIYNNVLIEQFRAFFISNNYYVDLSEYF